MDNYDMSEKRIEIIKATWEYLLRTGLENASVGDLCRETKMSQSSLYYWFENKEEIWATVGKYGISKVVNLLLKFTFNSTNDIQKYFETLLDEVEKYKYELRLAIQMTTSPVFGERMREKSKDFRLWYEKYAYELMSIFDCTYLEAETFIYSIIAYVVDYALWDDRDKTQMLLDNLHIRINKKLGI